MTKERQTSTKNQGLVCLNRAERDRDLGTKRRRQEEARREGGIGD